MKKSKFSNPEPNDSIRKKGIEANLANTLANKKEEIPYKFKKEKTKPLCLRAPESLWEDIHEVMARTGLSMNAICMELLRPEIKRKLKELREY